MTTRERGSLTLGVAILLCLDTLQIAEGPGDRAAQPTWARNAARLLGHARGQGWMVAHILRRRPTGLGRWREAVGLSPRPDERVFHREQPSAFSCVELLEIAPPNAEFVILGRSLNGSLLHTARDGLQRGFAIAMACDALAASPVERGRLAELAMSSAEGGVARMTFQNTVGIQGARAPLRLLQGGSADVLAVRAPSAWRRA